MDKCTSVVEGTEISCPFSCSDVCMKEKALQRNRGEVIPFDPATSTSDFVQEETQWVNRTHDLSTRDYFKQLRERRHADTTK